MDRNDRIDAILEMLRARGASPVNVIAESLGVSHMTVRRDIEVLVQEERVIRYHGGVRIVDHDDTAAYDLRRAESQHRYEKELIARFAAGLIQPGDTVFIDAGTTTEMIARLLPPRHDLTVVTTALNIINIATAIPGTRVIGTGGEYHESSGVFDGPEAIALLSRIRITRAFISANAVQFELGVTCSNQFEVAGKRQAMQSSLEKILVIDSSKMGHVVSAHFAEITEFDRVVMNRPDDGTLAECRSSGVNFDFVDLDG
jgi:DeoR family transcriptional regulator, deoxyribose operon repressor